MRAMCARPTAEPYVPQCADTDCLSAAVDRCRGCDLYERATQGVFGEGRSDADIMIVGEQPGDEEDVAGRPFVGPAGAQLDPLLERAGVERSDVWLTNAVKHFKFGEVRGGKRMHKKPTMLEVKACRPWLDAEIRIVSPSAIVVLGATAAHDLLGGAFRITSERGRVQHPPNLPPVVATWHPSAILRAPEREVRHRMRDEVVADLTTAVRIVQEPVATGSRIRE